MSLDWDAVRARYEPGSGIHPLVGGSRLAVVRVDDEQICVKQRLWQACVTRHELETAIDLLVRMPGPISAIEFAEELRTYYSGGSDVKTECSKVPNLSAVILKDLGYLD